MQTSANVLRLTSQIHVDWQQFEPVIARPYRLERLESQTGILQELASPMDQDVLPIYDQHPQTQARLDYPDWFAAGESIDSGQVEGGCENMISR